MSGTIDGHRQAFAADIQLPRPTPAELRATLAPVAESLDGFYSLAGSLNLLVMEEVATAEELATARALLAEAREVADAVVFGITAFAWPEVKAAAVSHVRAAINLLLGIEDLAYGLSFHDHWDREGGPEA